MMRVFGRTLVEYLPAAGLLVISIAYLFAASGYKPESRAVPEAVAWVMTGLLLLDLISRSETRTGRVLLTLLNPAALADERPDAAPAGRQIAAGSWILGFAAGLVVLGILTAVPLYVFGALYVKGRRSIAAALAAAAIATLAIWLLFAQALHLPLYAGLFAA
jgi:hypothetical protein